MVQVGAVGVVGVGGGGGRNTAGQRFAEIPWSRIMPEGHSALVACEASGSGPIGFRAKGSGSWPMRTDNSPGPMAHTLHNAT